MEMRRLTRATFLNNMQGYSISREQILAGVAVNNGSCAVCPNVCAFACRGIFVDLLGGALLVVSFAQNHCNVAQDHSIEGLIACATDTNLDMPASNNGRERK